MAKEETETVEGVVEVDLVVPDRIESAQLDMQITTAKRYPRSVVAFKKECEARACEDSETAASMFYRLSRKSKDGGSKAIEGPSVRLAEVVQTAWGHMNVFVRYGEVTKTDRFARAHAVAWDMERNVRVGIEVARRIIGKNGQQYNDDMIGVTMAAAGAIARRNAIFAVVPFAYVKDIFDKCKEVSVGKSLTMAQRRENSIKAYAVHHITEAQLLEYLERKGWEDVSLDDFIELRGLLTAIKDGETTAKDAFSAQEKTANLDAILKPESVKGADTPMEKKAEAADVVDASHVETVTTPLAQEPKDTQGREVLESDEHGPVVVKKPRKVTKEEPAKNGDRSVDELFG